MRRLALAAALALLAAAVVSCANTPTAPKAIAHLTGTVTDRNGAGVQAVYVDFIEIVKGPAPSPYFYPAEGIYVHLVTDLNGNYSGNVPAGSYWVWVTPPTSTGYVPILTQHEVLSGDQRFDYRFPHLRVAARPVLSGGQSADAAWAFIHSEDYFLSATAKHAGDTLEMFVTPGRYRVEASAFGLGFGYPDQEITIDAARDTSLSLSFAGNEVTTHVTGPGGGPAQAYIYAGSRTAHARAQVDGTGTAVLYLPNGGYTFEVDPADGTIQSRVFPFASVTGALSLDFGMDGTHWNGTVRRSSDGAPLADVRLRVYAIGNRSEVAYGSSDANGAFHFVVRPNWGHTIEVNYGAYRFDDVVAGADSTFDLVIPDSAAAAAAAALPDPRAERFRSAHIRSGLPRDLAARPR